MSNKSFFKVCVFIFSVLLVVSCDYGPKSDKVIEMVVAFKTNNNSVKRRDSVIKILKKRLQKITNNAEVVSVDNDKIRISVATHFNAERFKNYILNPGKLDFYETYKNDELIPFLMEVNKLAKTKDSTTNPLYDLIKPGGYQGGPILFSAEKKDTAALREYFSLKAAAFKLPNKKRFIKFLWGIEEKGTNYFPLYALKKNKLGKPALSGDVVINAFPIYNGLNQPAISMQMNEEGAEKWEILTGKAYQQRSNIAIVLNDQVYSAPGVSSGPIHGGRSEISGDFTVEEAQDFANILVSGRIPEMKLVHFTVEKIN